MSGGYPTPPKRVVLVEDISEMRGLLRYWLEGDERFEVVGEAPDGARGISVVEELQPDVVVLDLFLPVVDGLTALRKIREAAPDAKVVVVSGGPGNHSREDLLALGAAAFVERVEFISTMEAVVAACSCTHNGKVH